MDSNRLSIDFTTFDSIIANRYLFVHPKVVKIGILNYQQSCSSSVKVVVYFSTGGYKSGKGPLFHQVG